MFNAFWDGMEYIVYLKGANGETKTTLAPVSDFHEYPVDPVFEIIGELA